MSERSPSTERRSDPARHALVLRIASLRAELDASEAPGRKAALHHELGVLLEEEFGNHGAAVKEYLAAINADGSFRPPLFALIRIFERRRSFKNLGRLYEAELRSASTRSEQVTALLDLGVLAEDRQGADALPFFEKALEADPESAAAALMLERDARKGNEPELTLRAIVSRATATRDPILKNLLLSELAVLREAEGDVDGAMEALGEALALPAARFRTLDLLIRFARRHQRWKELAEGLEAQAEIAYDAAKGGGATETSGAFSIQRFADTARAMAKAGALYYEAGRVRREGLADPEGALRLLDKALSLSPEDPLLRQEHMLAAEAASSPALAEADTLRLLGLEPSGATAATLHFRLAEAAQARGELDSAREHLGAALEADPSSTVAAALLDDLLIDRGEHAERIRLLRERAERISTEGGAICRWRAAQIASERLGDFPLASGLYRQAAEAAADRRPILRELAGAAERHGDPGTAAEAITSLLECELEPDERAVLLRGLISLHLGALGDRAGAIEVARRALGDEAAEPFAPELGRLLGARARDYELLAQAHRALAARAGDDATIAAHLCAAARALWRAEPEGSLEAPLGLLREALERVPGHRYATALLEETLRARGEAEEVVALLKARAEAQEGAEAAELSLLLAAAAAEASGDREGAAKTYEEAADHDPTSMAPLWGLRRLAKKSAQPDLLLRALEALSQRELVTQGVGRATLELAEHYDLVSGSPTLAEAPLLELLGLDQGPLCAHAALRASMLRVDRIEPALRSAAAASLHELDPSDPSTLGLREQLALCLEPGEAPEPARLEQASSLLGSITSGAPWVDHMRLRLSTLRSASLSGRADAWMALGAGSTDAAVAEDLFLHGLRTSLLHGDREALEDALLLTGELLELSPGSLHAAVALDETLQAGDDPDGRADALAIRAARCPERLRPPIDAALGRALTLALRSEEAVEQLRAVIARSPDDLASVEALRVAARNAGAWAEVVQACDTLAEHVDGEVRVQLLEEAGAVLMDHLGKDAEAEMRLRAALDIDMERPIAYGRLHDLLTERDDTTSLLSLVDGRIDSCDEPSQLERLFYEKARLLRAEGRLEDALRALEGVLALDEEHAGAIALSIEIHVALGSWEEAVRSLRRLARCDVPSAQKRVAHLGAADFLEKRLGDSKAAIRELEAVHALGLGDLELDLRIAALAERSEDFESSVRALLRAAATSEPEDRAPRMKHVARLQRDRLGLMQEAALHFEAALASAPMDLEAAQELVDLRIDPMERRAIGIRVETTMRGALDRLGPDEEALRGLMMSCLWKEEADAASLARTALVCLELANEDEKDADDERTAVFLRAQAGRTLGPDALAALRARGDEGAAAELLSLASESLSEALGIDAAFHGVGRSDLLSARTPSPLRDELFGLVSLFGIEPTDLYIGGPDAARLVGLHGKKGRSTWVVGGGIRAPLDSRRRLEAARYAMGLRTGALPLLGRSASEGAKILLACCLAADRPLAAGAAHPDLEALAKRIGRAMPRKVRKAVAELAGALPGGGAGLESFVRSAQRSCLRAGMLVCGDLETTLVSALRGPVGLDAVLASPTATDLLLFWVSTTHHELRRSLGLSS
ncbi:MAG: tetratricopeptide repeat protein [Myxococcales bacterium]|nr:tetratricopeptide repeat protein [Myxococcales bacterium]